MLSDSVSRRRLMKFCVLGSALGALSPSAFSAQTLPLVSAKKVLVIYFSMSETDQASNMTQEEDNSTVVIDGQVLGNTQYLAQLIATETKGEIYRISPLKPYPKDHKTLVDLAKNEQDANARPVIAGTLPAFDQYDTIFLGYPNWWGDFPMIMYSFLEQVDLSGKTVVPFNTHGGSGFSDTIETIIEKQPKAQVIKEGLTISRSRMQTAPQRVKQWLSSLGSKTM